MKELIRIMVQSLVENPEKVEIEEIPGNTTTVYEIKVAKQDLGKVIGKNGRTASSMRNILNAAHVRLNRRAVLEIVE